MKRAGKARSVLIVTNAVLDYIQALVEIATAMANVMQAMKIGNVVVSLSMT